MYLAAENLGIGDGCVAMSADDNSTLKSFGDGPFHRSKSNFVANHIQVNARKYDDERGFQA